MLIHQNYSINGIIHKHKLPTMYSKIILQYNKQKHKLLFPTLQEGIYILISIDIKERSLERLNAH